MPGPFQRVEVPRRHRRSLVNRHARWYTWSADARRILAAWRRGSESLDLPDLVHLDAASPYSATYGATVLELADAVLAEEVLRLARSLATLERPAHLMLLTDLFTGLDSRSLHLLLAHFRAILAAESGDDHAALYAPLGTTGAAARGFPLHADLYRPEMLWVIFDDVPADDSGASLFLPVASLLDLIDGLAEVPVDVRRQVRECFEAPADRDRFDELFSLLYGTTAGWCGELRERLLAAQLQIKLQRGEGYLLHDRTWLHGRTEPSGGVTAHRLHRLIFDCRTDDRRRRRRLHLRGRGNVQDLAPV